MYRISSPGEFILVQFSEEILYPQVVSAVEETMAREDYSRLNDIWVLDGKLVDIRLDQFDLIVQAVQKVYPSNAKRSKTALVASSGFIEAIAREFLKAADSLPQELRLFSNLDEAKDWVLQPV